MKVDKVLLVGLGSIGKRHLANFKLILPLAKLAILRSQKRVGAVGGYEVALNIEAALGFQPQVAFICNPSNFHLGVATELAKAGVHLFIEKPLSDNLEGVDEFMEVARSANIKVMVGYNLRFSPSLLKFRELIQSERLGHTLCVSAEVGQYLPDWRPEVDYRSTVSAQSKLGGGVLLELSHELDYLIWLFGKAVSISARLIKVSDLEIDVEDLVQAHIDFEKHGRRVPASVQLDFLQRQPYRRCKVICEKGTLVWDAILSRVEVHQQGGSRTFFQDDNDKNFTYEQEIKTFISCVETGDSIPIDAQDGLRVLELVEAIKKSSELGEVVHL